MSTSTRNVDFYDDLRKRLEDIEFKGEFGTELAKADLGIALAEARHAAGLTQAALAELVGVRQSYIAKLEGGEANPTIGTLGKILAILGKRLIFSFGNLPDKTTTTGVYTPTS
ncbi:MAG: transcriptional regulator [Dehalococcoidia bacterium]|nr:transcriptional regulator [Dehalococcoidia bacterium]